ncbi:glycosyltransferase family 2 protein [Hydrocarboniclastica marina]|uniref:Glycosyltransferase n=1 Tax=Hydrocarboniclastica marina TaxID=2259620 RepID=A0A4P7XFV4_9ALTE|nr:glycosyltransferase family 2 protein [Hydrocarboniclastica marina]MAL99569.1 glycosyl transferase family 2 [Alteromonadaceae bacterium]QCF25022.1 glycosyltransferase [Hydrocarboniclastica marina]|tara:strand:+ start:1649 stop:2518 length:870 start_codon:yes stop_codon:yes gene_type:complete
MTPQRIGVVITTYNSPLWLSKVLTGYEAQSDKQFTVIVADDGSTRETGELIGRFQARGQLVIDHVWHEDDGFRKCTILNKAIAGTDCDYLIFTDGDCIPEPDFVSTHRAMAAPGHFLSGGYIKLTMPVSEHITDADISSGDAFDPAWLVRHGQPRSHKLWKLSRSRWKKRLLNALTPAAASWNGMNSSTWTKDLVAVNGFNEDMQYGGLDRELGERLWNYGHKSMQIRYSTVCLHLDHARGYSKPEVWARNRAIRQAVKDNKTYWAENGIEKKSQDPATAPLSSERARM